MMRFLNQITCTGELQLNLSETNAYDKILNSKTECESDKAISELSALLGIRVTDCIEGYIIYAVAGYIIYKVKAIRAELTK